MSQPSSNVFPSLARCAPSTPKDTPEIERAIQHLKNVTGMASEALKRTNQLRERLLGAGAPVEPPQPAVHQHTPGSIGLLHALISEVYQQLVELHTNIADLERL